MDGLLEGGEFVGFGRDEFLGHVAFESGVDDRFHDGWIVELLGFVDFMASWHAAGVVVSEVSVIAFDGAEAGEVPVVLVAVTVKV